MGMTIRAHTHIFKECDDILYDYLAYYYTYTGAVVLAVSVGHIAHEACFKVYTFLKETAGLR